MISGPRRTPKKHPQRTKQSKASHQKPSALKQTTLTLDVQLISLMRINMLCLRYMNASMQVEKLIFIANHAALKRGTIEDDLVEMETVALADAALQAELAAMRASEQQQQAGPSTAIQAAEDDTHSVETLDVSKLLQDQEAV